MSPRVSIVMAVHDEQDSIQDTMESIRGQTFEDMEIVVVDDGSSDGTVQMLKRIRRKEPRLVVHERPHRGLTASLIEGCRVATGEFVARHDAGDRSDRRRIEMQLEHALDDSSRALISCTTRHLAPDGELLYQSGGSVDDRAVRWSLLNAPARSIRGISSHPSAFFRRSDYQSVGGYREAFRVAQDLDLWIRLAARGRVSFVQEPLYDAVFRPTAISARRRRLQVHATRFAVAIRDQPERTDELLAELQKSFSNHLRGQAEIDAAEAWYFVGRCLQRRKDPAALKYLRRSIREHPYHLRAILAWLQEMLRQ